MQKLVIIMLILASIITLTGCKKDKANSDNPTEINTKKIIGKWNLLSYDYQITEPSKPVRKLHEKADPGDYFNFSADGILYRREGAGTTEQHGAYTINSYQVKGEYETYTITKLTDNELKLEQMEDSEKSTIKIIYNFSR